MMLDTTKIDTPLGALTAFVSEGKLVALDFPSRDAHVARALSRRYGAFTTRTARDPAGVRTAIEAYFAGDVRAIEALETDGAGTPFQRRVWAELRRIPVGTTISYGTLAARIDNPTAVRAVGAANGANPISLVVPCHRVIASDGSLHGYGGGLDRKAWLLEHEARRAAAAPGARPRQLQLIAT